MLTKDGNSVKLEYVDHYCKEHFYRKLKMNKCFGKDCGNNRTMSVYCGKCRIPSKEGKRESTNDEMYTTEIPDMEKELPKIREELEFKDGLIMVKVEAFRCHMVGCNETSNTIKASFEIPFLFGEGSTEKSQKVSHYCRKHFLAYITNQLCVSKSCNEKLDSHSIYCSKCSKSNNHSHKGSRKGSHKGSRKGSRKGSHKNKSSHKGSNQKDDGNKVDANLKKNSNSTKGKKSKVNKKNNDVNLPGTPDLSDDDVNVDDIFITV
jgi:hypothetical protein